ncbi:serine protease FAM111A-like [Pagrus major]|uniref:serine protease FAM111A-like n=1 Tax=Pagrus major TaxID=143350 RepID=UPI003CC8B54B
MPLTQRQLGSAPAPSHPPDKQEKKPHATHSFEWCGVDRKLTNITCDKAGTIESTLLRSEKFKGIAEKNKDKELVILRDGKAISSHFPCCLIKKKRLTVRYVKAVGKQKQSFENRGYINSRRKGASDKPVMFHVLTKGGKNVVRIMRNPALRRNIEEITVYAYKGEKVKHALRRDGRLLITVFKKNCVLSHTSTDVTTEMSSLVDDLDGKTFKITLLDKSPPPESPPSSVDDAYMMQNDYQRSDCDGNQDPPQQSATTESENDNRPKEKPELKGDMASEKNPDTMQCKSSSQVKDLVKRMKTLQGSKPSYMQDYYRVEYGKNDQTCREVKTMKKLMELSNSVCHVRINGRPAGSGFLLFDKFVLTNGHVIKNIYSETTGQLDERVTVHFSYESLDQMESGAEVEEVAGFEYSDETEHKYDWALLRLSAEQNLPDGLLKHFGFHSQSGGICIIGHPDGGVKKIEPCLIVSFDSRCQVVERHYRENQEHVQLVTPRFFEGAAEWVKQKKQVLTYESSFYFGSSGSPVFDEHCNVVAMHSGGYVYCNESGQSQSVIEYGYPVSLIIEQAIVQLVEGGRFDVLKKYLACSYARHQNMMSNLKKLVDGRNLTAFRNAAKSPVVINDASLKTFFEFLCWPEEPVPMDFD